MSDSKSAGIILILLHWIGPKAPLYKTTGVGWVGSGRVKVAKEKRKKAGLPTQDLGGNLFLAKICIESCFNKNQMLLQSKPDLYTNFKDSFIIKNNSQ